MRNYVSFLEKLVGKNLPITLQTAIMLMEDGTAWLEDLLSGRRDREKSFDHEHGQFTGDRQDRRIRSSYEATTDGYRLLRMKALHGPTGWGNVVRSLGISLRTSHNLMALAIFARQDPARFRRLAFLGPTKLYRLARLPKEELDKIDPDKRVAVPGQPGLTKAVMHLTDRELETYLRTVCPPEKRSQWPKVRRLAVGLQRMLENLPKNEALPPRSDLELICNVATYASHRAMELFDQAA